MRWKLMLITAILTSLAIMSLAQNAYFYIEGDQETPIYVKVEGKMMERLGKNYSIIPNLAAGYTQFEILFEQNKYPAQKFILEVPETGARGFVLNKVNEKQFALYDLEQKRFILAGNNIGDDYVLPAIAERQKEDQEFYHRSQEVTAKELLQRYGQTSRGAELNTQNQAVFMDDVILNDPSKSSQVPKNQQIRTPKQRIRYTEEELKQSNLSHFAEDFELHEGAKAKDNTSLISTTNELPPIPNTDCPTAMSNQEFEQIALRFINLSDDTQKLRMLRRRPNKNCYSTEQVRILANNMESQSGKFEVVKMLYIQTSDQEQYAQLEQLFDSSYIQSEFREMLNR